MHATVARIVRNKNPVLVGREGRIERRVDGAVAEPEPLPGRSSRARTEPVSWLEADPIAFPRAASGEQWLPIGPLRPLVTERSGLSQWRGRAGFTPVFR